jgi:hypothetical protein
MSSETKPALGTPLRPGSGTVVEAKITREEAINAATRMFTIPAELGEPNVNKNLSRDSATWSLNWQSNEKMPDRLSIHVEVDAVTGAILGYNKGLDKADPDSAPPAYTRADAATFAVQWMGKLIPGDKGAYRLVDVPEQFGYYGPVDAGYSFRWERIEQGYPVQNDSVSIAIDARTGELRSFNHNWQRNVTYTLPPTLLSEGGATTIYREQIAMQLYYQHFQQPGTDKGEWKLVYRPLSGYPSINQEGKLLDRSGQPVDLSQVQEIMPVPAPDKPYVAPKQLLTEAEARLLAAAVSGRTDPPTNTNYSEYGKDETKTQGWSFSWNKNGELNEGETNTNISIDALRGIVLNYSNWSRYDPVKKDEKLAITQAQARATALEFIRTNRPDLAGKLVLMPGDPKEAERIVLYGSPSYGVSFGFRVNEVLVADRNGSVEVDARTGKVRSFWVNDQNYVKDEFPAVPQTILKPIDAVDAFLSSQGLELAWGVFYPEIEKAKMAGQMPDPVSLLVWAPGNRLNVAALDARTGAPLDWQGRDLMELAKHPTDINGHFAQREIELLWGRQIFDLKDGKFRPDEVATAADLARWLVLAKGMRPYPMYDFALNFGGKGEAAMTAGSKLMNAPAAPYFGAALQAGIFLPEDFDLSTDPAGPVSREIFALWSARAMGYGNVVKMANRIDMSLADKEQIGARFANAVALLNGLGAVKGDPDGKFSPQRPITRGEAAKLLFAVVTEMRR